MIYFLLSKSCIGTLQVTITVFDLRPPTNSAFYIYVFSVFIIPGSGDHIVYIYVAFYIVCMPISSGDHHRVRPDVLQAVPAAMEQRCADHAGTVR